MRLVWLLLGFAGCSSIAHASDDVGKYMSHGPGAVSCGTFVQAENGTVPDAAGIRQDILSWTTGYLTAYNRLTDDVYDIYGQTDSRGIELWLYRYCAARPLQTFDDALHALIQQLYPLRRIAAPQ
jgi:hypothetical protein